MNFDNFLPNGDAVSLARDLPYVNVPTLSHFAPSTAYSTYWQQLPSHDHAHLNG